MRIAAVAILGSACCKCGFSDYRAFHIDHINSDGNKEKYRSGATYWNQIIKSVLAKENKYQLLCANCNFIKRHEANEAPGRPRNK